MRIIIAKQSKQILLASFVALLTAGITYIFLMPRVSASDKVALTMAALGYFFWPIYRLAAGTGKGWANALLLVVFCICLSMGGCSYLSMREMLAQTPPPTDAGDLIMVVWGAGLLSLCASFLISVVAIIARAKQNNDRKTAIITILTTGVVLYALFQFGVIGSISGISLIILVLGITLFIFARTVHQFRIRRKLWQATLRCAYCKDTLHSEAAFVCSSCGSPHHTDCYASHGCAIFACSSSKPLVGSQKLNL